MDDVDVRCPECSNPVPPKGPTGPRKTYCSDRCRQKANSRRATEKAKQKVARARASAKKTCPTCSTVFTPAKSLSQKYCSKTCRPNSLAYSMSSYCTVDGCDRPRAARELCKMHYRREARGDGRERPPEWDDRRRANHQVRRERLAGGRNSDRTILAGLLARPDRECPECGDEIDLSLKWPDPKSRTIDHIVPIALGGKHELENCQLMHLSCNASKGVNLPVIQ